jgi:iron complex transport system substrate-binding protein
MNRWYWLIIGFVCWMAIGIVVLGSQEKRSDNESSRAKMGAERIVSLAPSLTEILFALGLDEGIVGVTIFSDYPPAAAKKPEVGSFWTPNMEAVVAARPDLVITLGFGQHKSFAQRLERIGYDCLTVDIEKISDLFRAISEIGVALGMQPRADELTSSIKNKLQALSDLIGTEEKVRVLWVVQREPLRVAGRDTFVNEMIELAGGENAIGPTLHKYPPIGAEQVIASRAEVVIEPAMGREDLDAQRQQAIQYWSKFGNLPAVANERIYVINGDTVSRLGPRLYDGTETIARCLRPHLLED